MAEHVAKLFTRWLAAAVAFYLSALSCPTVELSGWWFAGVAAGVWMVVRLVIKPFFLTIFMPINVLTWGMSIVLINAGLVWLAAALTPGFWLQANGWLFVVVAWMTTVDLGVKFVFLEPWLLDRQWRREMPQHS